MRKFKKLFALLAIALIAVFVFAACEAVEDLDDGQTPPPTNAEQPDNPENEEPEDEEEEPGDDTPDDDPTETALTKTDYLAARNATINANQFEYGFNLSITTELAQIAGPTAVSEGDVKYNSTAQNSYLKTENNGGALLPNGTIYTALQGEELAKFKVNENDKLYDFSVEDVEENFTYESSIYAKSLFEVGAENITGFQKQSNGKYKLILDGTFTDNVNSIVNFLNNPILGIFIDVPENDVEYSVYVTLANGKIKTYEYDFSISVTEGSIDFHYDLEFLNIGGGVQITLPVFPGYSLTQNDITNDLNQINNALNEYKNREFSGHEYDVDVAADHAGLGENDYSVQGTTVRKKDGENIYFNNYIDYGGTGDNYERNRANLLDGSVYDADNQLIGDDFTELTNYDNGATDNYYMLLANGFFAAGNVSFIEKPATAATGVYGLYLNGAGVAALMEFIENAVRTDVTGANELAMFAGFTGPGEIKNAVIEITVADGKLVEITVDVDGSYTAGQESVDFRIDYALTVSGISEYAVPESTDDIELT